MDLKGAFTDALPPKGICSVLYTAGCSVDCLLSTLTVPAVDRQCTLHHCKFLVTAQSMQPMCSHTLLVPCSYTACTLQFDLGPKEGMIGHSTEKRSFSMTQTIKYSP